MAHVSDAKRYTLTADEVKAMRETLGKCVNPATGEPVSARNEEYAVLPVKGSVTPSADGHGRGTCPHCGAHVALSKKGFLTAHKVRHNPVPVTPPAVRLVERQAEVTDSGARVGSPDAAMRTRDAELRANAGTATVKIKVKAVQPDGTSKMVLTDVPGTEENVRTALRQEYAKKQRPVRLNGKPVMRTDPETGNKVPVMGGGPDPKLIARYSAMLKGITGTEAVRAVGAQPGTYKVREAVTLDAPNAPQGRDESCDPDRRGDARGHVPTSPGPALVQGPAMSGAVPTDKDRQTSTGKPRNAIGWSGPLGRPRPDRVAVSGNAEACGGKGCTVGGCVAIVGGRYGYLECHVFRLLSKSKKRHYWEHVATCKRRADDAKGRVRPDMPYRQWPTSRQSMQGGSAVRMSSDA